MLTLLFVGCSSIPIKSENGSFRNSLKPEYYKKGDYKRVPRYDQKLTNVDVDEIIQQGRIIAYHSTDCFVGYEKLTKEGRRPIMGDDEIRVGIYRLYVDNKTKGFIILIFGDFGNEYHTFITHQEVTLNKEGKYIIRENIPEKEVTRKRIKWEDSH